MHQTRISNKKRNKREIKFTKNTRPEAENTKDCHSVEAFITLQIKKRGAKNCLTNCT